MSQVVKEIHEQPEALERLLRDGRESVEVVAARVRASAPRFGFPVLPIASSIPDDPQVLGRR